MTQIIDLWALIFELTDRESDHFFIGIWLDDDIFHNRSYGIVSSSRDVRCPYVPPFTRGNYLRVSHSAENFTTIESTESI